jgi:hypothetical protein
VLFLIGLATAATLYLFQAANRGAASIRYLLPMWVFLPGLLANGLLACSRLSRVLATLVLIAIWTVGQINLFAEMDRPKTERALIARLDSLKVPAIVARGALAILVADLSNAHIGAVEFHSTWPRLSTRYAGRFRPEGPIFVVLDSSGDGWVHPDHDPAFAIHELSSKTPARAHMIDELGTYQIWRVDMPLSEFMSIHIPPLSDASGSAKLKPGRVAPTAPSSPGEPSPR